MRVLLGPVVVDHRVCRIVSPLSTLLEVEEWVGEWWEPSLVPLTRASCAPLATPELLVACGIPPADWGPVTSPLTSSEVEAMMQVADEDHPADLLALPVARAPERPVRRAYPGNRKFRHGTLGPYDSGYERPDRRHRSDPNYRGPWRRATDVPDDVS